MFENLKEKQAARKAAEAAGQGQPSIKLYVDIVSPFAWIAFYALENHPSFAAVKKTYVPIFLGGVMQATNNRPPITIRNKDRFINAERLRWRDFFAVPMHDDVPDGFPPNTLRTMRVLTALAQSHPHLLTPAIDALFRAMWTQHTPVWEPDRLVEVLAGVMESEAQARDVVERGGAPEVKEALTKRTGEAIEGGAFGLPWFACRNAKGETLNVWGVDHLGVVCDFLELPRTGRGLKAML